MPYRREHPMAAPMPSLGAQITIKGTKTIKMLVVLLDHLFIRATIGVDYRPPESQDITILQPWINAHNLKEDVGEWYKDGRKGKVTQAMEIRRKHH